MEAVQPPLKPVLMRQPAARMLAGCAMWMTGRRIGVLSALADGGCGWSGMSGGWLLGLLRLLWEWLRRQLVRSAVGRVGHDAGTI